MNLRLKHNTLGGCCEFTLRGEVTKLFVDDFTDVPDERAHELLNEWPNEIETEQKAASKPEEL